MMNISTETIDYNYEIDGMLRIKTELEVHEGRLCDIREGSIFLDMSDGYRSNVLEILFVDIVDIEAI